MFPAASSPTTSAPSATTHTRTSTSTDRISVAPRLRGLPPIHREAYGKFPGGGLLHIMNAAAPLSARKTRLFVPICRNFDKDSPIEETLDFNYQVFDEDIAIVEQQFPEDLPLKLHDEAHFLADRSSVTYRKGLAALGLGRTYTA